MSILVGDIARARLSHDLQQHLEEEDAAEPETGRVVDGTGRDGDGKKAPDVGDGGEPSGYLLECGSESGSGTDPMRALTPTEFDAAIALPEGDAEGVSGFTYPRRLLVLRGLPAEYVRCILRNRELGIDPAFLDAHAERRGYRPAGTGRGGARLFEYWEYPELVQGFGPEAERHLKERGDVVDGMKAPAVHGVGHRGLAAVFCRVALWASARCTPILFLEHPLWSHRASLLRRARRRLSIASQRSADDSPVEAGAEIPSLEDTLRKALAAGWYGGVPGGNMLVEAVYNSWLDFFEVLEPPAAQHASREAAAAYYWQILRSLEQNKHIASLLLSQPWSREISTYADWGSLLSQVHQRVALLAATPISRNRILTPASTGIVASRRADSKNFDALGATGTLPPGRTPGRTGRGVLDDENHRALDRISYLGGILIPLPIVSSILSMGEAFGPDGPKFYIFWATSIPLSILAVLIIYADTIRKAEVWVEVAAEQVAALSSSTDVEEAIDDGNEKTDASRRWRRRPGAWQDVEAQVVPDAQTRILETATTTVPVEVGGEEKEDAVDLGDETAMPALVSLPPELLGVERAPQAPNLILEESVGGRKAKAWKRQKLGWYGAAKAIVYHKPRYCADEAPQGVAAYDKRQRKT